MVQITKRVQFCLLGLGVLPIPLPSSPDRQDRQECINIGGVCSVCSVYLGRMVGLGGTDRQECPAWQVRLTPWMQDPIEA